MVLLFTYIRSILHARHTNVSLHVSIFYQDNGIHKLYTVKRFCNGLDETVRAFAVRLFTERIINVATRRKMTNCCPKSCRSSALYFRSFARHNLILWSHSWAVSRSPRRTPSLLHLRALATCELNARVIKRPKPVALTRLLLSSTLASLSTVYIVTVTIGRVLRPLYSSTLIFCVKQHQAMRSIIISGASNVTLPIITTTPICY